MKRLSIFTVGIFLAACVDASADFVTGDANTSDPLRGAAEIIKQFQLIDGYFVSSDSSSTCVAICADISTKRQQIQATQEWFGIKKTAEYWAVKRNLEKFMGAGCKMRQTDAQTCGSLGKDLETWANLLAKISEWQAMISSTIWQDLEKSYDHGRSLDCVS